MNKMNFETPDLAQANVEKLAELFPSVVTEGRDANGRLKKAVNFEALRQLLSSAVLEGEEAYEFTWVGKKAAIVESGRPVRKTLRPYPEESKNWDTTENLYIEGDNLTVLKLLQENYLGKVKMIYIDPPYNTGNDFIYRDNFAADKDDWQERTGEVEKNENGERQRLFRNTDSNGRFHSDWCSMIYPRLMLARNLLSDDGVIFISCDDNEQENLKKICDEIFGSDSFIGIYIKQSKVGGGSDSKFIVKEHEYCLVYAKNIHATPEMFIEHNQEYLRRYKEEDENGKYFWDTFARPGLKNPLFYDITAPDGTVIHNGWIHSKDRFLNEYANGDVRIIKFNNKWSVQFKQYLNLNGKKPRSLSMDFGGTIDGKNEITNLFKNNKIFPYPKSSIFIKQLLSTVDNKTNTSIILDFFSGSATTAHAVMQLNAEDGGKRKFIMVQLPEECAPASEAAKAGYKNICEIGKERIRRAGEKLKQDNAGKPGIENLDIGFRVLKCDSSNMKDVYYAPKETTQDNLRDLISNIKEDRSDLDLLFGCLVEWGLPLSLPYKTEEICGYPVHFYDYAQNPDESTALAACFDVNISEAALKEIARRKPLRAVFRDASFAASEDRINAGELFKTLAPDTSVKVI